MAAAVASPAQAKERVLPVGEEGEIVSALETGMLHPHGNLVPARPPAIWVDDDDLQMPPEKRLPDTVVNDFRKWIQSGAVWPESTGDSPDSAFQAARPSRTKPMWLTLE